MAHNILFEERASPHRRQLVEDTAVARHAETDIGTALEVHYKSKITVGDVHEHPTFSNHNDAAAYGPIEKDEWLIRLENLSCEVDRVSPAASNAAAAKENAKTLAAFRAVGNGTSTPETVVIVNNFLRQWNSYRDFRPMFAGPDAELGADAKLPNWPVRLRDRLGLAHYKPKAEPLIVCLMRYQVAEVIEAADRSLYPVPNRFLSPTALDCGNWPYFYPAPKECVGGRAVYLDRVSDYEHFFAEMLHFRIDYQFKHISKVGILKEPVKGCAINCMRNSHLDALQLAFDQYSFGRAMPETCLPRCPYRP